MSHNSRETPTPAEPTGHTPQPGQDTTFIHQQALPAGNTSQQALPPGYISQQASRASYVPQQPGQMGYAPQQAPAAGYAPQQAPPAGYSHQQAPPSGYAAHQALPAGYTHQQAPPSGYAAHQALPAGYTHQQAPPFGYAVQQALPAGYTHQHASPSGYPYQQVPPSGYAPHQAPPAGYTHQQAFPAGYAAHQSPSASYGNQQSLPAGYTSQPGYIPQQPPSTMYNTGSTVNLGCVIGSMTNYTANNSSIEHFGPKTIKNITVEDLTIDLGIKKDDSEKFWNLLGEEKDKKEYLQKLVNLNKEHKFDLPSVSKMTKSTCLIHYMGDHGGKWHGTGFLSTFPDFEGAVLLSAGHNFEDNGELLKDFHKFELYFNNERGILNVSHLRDDKSETVINKKLTNFIQQFASTTLVLTYGGKQLIKCGNQTGKEKKHRNLYLDYFALVLHDKDAKQKLKDMGLDFLETANKEELKQSGEPVFIFGHPGLKSCICCKRSSSCACKNEEVCLCHKACNCGPSTPPCSCRPVPCHHPSCSCQHLLRFSYAMSKDGKIEDRIKYYLDTLSGNSGSPITGAKYKAKGIHISATKSGKRNEGQSLRAVLKDLQSLKILKNFNKGIEKFTSDLEKCTLQSDSDSSDNSSHPPSPTGQGPATAPTTKYFNSPGLPPGHLSQPTHRGPSVHASQHSLSDGYVFQQGIPAGYAPQQVHPAGYSHQQSLPAGYSPPSVGYSPISQTDQESGVCDSPDSESPASGNPDEDPNQCKVG